MTVDFTAGAWRIRMTYSVDALDGQCLSHLATMAAELYRGIPGFDRFLFERDANNPSLFSYRIWLSDTRQWRQTLLFTAPVDAHPLQTFDVTPGWRDTEFVEHRDWRELMVRFRNLLGASLVRIDRV